MGTAAWSRIAVPGLGRKFWTITSCTCPCRRWLSAIASSASTRSASVSPMPTRIPVVNGIAQLAGGLQGRQPSLGGLVGRTAVGGQVGPQRLDHHPLGRRHLRSWRGRPGTAPAFAWGSSPVSSSTRAHIATR